LSEASQNKGHSELAIIFYASSSQWVISSYRLLLKRLYNFGNMEKQYYRRLILDRQKREGHLVLPFLSSD
jgi:hypothetical protein